MLTGFRDLDALTGGFSAGDLVMLGGEDDDARSAFALSVAVHGAQHGEVATVFSLATNREMVTLRLISMLASVPVAKLLGGAAGKRDWPALFRAPHNPTLSRLRVVDAADLGVCTVGEIRDRARQISVRCARGPSPLSLVVVDPLRLVGGAALMSKQRRRRDQAATVIQLKRLARHLRVPVLLVGNFANAVDRRQDGPSVPADLEVSRVAADRIDKVLELRVSGPEDAAEAELLVARQRGGPAGSVGLIHDADRGAFRSVPQRSASPDR